MLSICLFWDIINVTYLGHYHNYFIEIRNNKIQNLKNEYIYDIIMKIIMFKIN